MRTLLGIFLWLPLCSIGQTIFKESMSNGSGGSSGDPITVHQQNLRFENQQLYFSGTGTLRTTSDNIPADYLQSSGGFNIELDTNQHLIIDGVETHATQDLRLFFGVRKRLNSENGTNLIVSYSTEGVNGAFTPVSFDVFPTSTGSTGWYYRMTDYLPHQVTTIKFEALTDDWHLDDIALEVAQPQINFAYENHPITHLAAVSEANGTDFGNHTLNYYSKTRTYTITNKGTYPLTIGSVIHSESNHFKNGTSFPIIIQPNETYPLVIEYLPTEIGFHENTITILSNDVSQPTFTLQTSGTGVHASYCKTTREPIALQSFENQIIDTWDYTFTAANVNTFAGVKNGYTFGESGKRNGTPTYLNGNSFQANENTAEITLASINTTKYENIRLQFKLGSYSETAGNGSDVDDYVRVLTRTNTENEWISQMEIRGYANAKWSLTSGRGTVYAVHNQEEQPVIKRPTSGGYKIEEGYNTVILDDLPNSENLQIKLVLHNDFHPETWAIDNIELTGTRKEIRVWNNQQWDATPDDYATVILQDNYDTAQNNSLTACTCTINEGNAVIVRSNDFIEIHGALHNYGQLNVENNGSLVQHNNYASNIGIGTFRRNTTPLKALDYTYWSSPVESQMLERFAPAPYFQYDTQNKKWERISGRMMPGKGYIMRASTDIDYSSGDVTFNGVFQGIPNNGIITTPLIKGESTWNLIGNPYPSALNADVFLTHSENDALNGTLYFWTHGTPISNGSWGYFSADDYALYNLTGGIAAKSGGAVPDQYVASGQGFFIEAHENGLVYFDNSMRNAVHNNQFFKNSFSEKDRLWLNLTGEKGTFKQLLIGYIPGASDLFDRKYDGKVRNGNNTISFYSVLDTLKLGIQGRKYPFSAQDKIQLGYSCEESGSYSITLFQKEGILTSQNIYIKDLLTQKHHLLNESSYTFDTEAGSFDDRFELVYLEKNLSASEKTVSSSEVVVFSESENTVIVHSESETLRAVSIYSILGQQITQQNINNQTGRINLIKTKSPIILHIQLNDGTVIRKKIIH
jgi:hypothetical protein